MTANLCAVSPTWAISMLECVFTHLQGFSSSKRMKNVGKVFAVLNNELVHGAAVEACLDLAVVDATSE